MDEYSTEKERSMKRKAHRIQSILPGSIAEELEIEAGDLLLSVNQKEIEDIFDYQFLIQDTDIEILIEKADGEQWLLEVEKDFDEDLGIEFETGLMDAYRRCRNQCIFCFIDQMPPDMRETLYFKDDDSRLSFLQGNYVTLTNMSEHDIDRICRYHLSPINISFHTMNPELRCRMLNNRFAGEALKKVDVLHAAGIRMNGQIVLCRGVNDGSELVYSIEQLIRYIPCLESVSIVPVGLTKYREGLYPLEPFSREDAVSVIETVEKYQQACYTQFGTHFVHASDEWYILAEREMPEAKRYDGYLQLENGVGMLRLLLDEFEECLEHLQPDTEVFHQEELSIATGKLPGPYIQRMARRMMDIYPGMVIHVYPVTNDFFGEQITVSGLLTGQDLLAQLTGRPLGNRLLLPENVLRSGEDVFLDDMRVGELEKALQVPINIVKSSGTDFVEAILGERIAVEE
jgi:putative radical SAM enzyme (TIGR03279 family)